MIRVAIADDSAFTCRLLASYLDAAGDCEVVGMAHDARSTIDLVHGSRPDVLTLDLDMPGGGGLDLLRRIAGETPVAVVIISGVTRRAASTTLRALELGAVDFVLKFTPDAPATPASLRREIVSKIRMAASVRAAGRHSPYTEADGSRSRPKAGFATGRGAQREPLAAGGEAVIVIGASTGGPPALREMLAQLPPGFPTPCVIIQHLPAAFTAAFAAELGRHVKLPVREAVPGDRLEPGRLLVAPGARHLLLRPGRRLEMCRPAAEDVYRPSIDLAMMSAAETYGSASVGVVLSGMGSDGAEGLKRIRACGGKVYVQEPASCVVASMPVRALEHAGADFVGAPDLIGSMLAERGQP